MRQYFWMSAFPLMLSSLVLAHWTPAQAQTTLYSQRTITFSNIDAVGYSNTFEGEAGQVIAIQLASAAPATQIELSLANSGSPISTSGLRHLQSTDQVVLALLPRTGLYQVQVNLASQNPSSDTFSLTVRSATNYERLMVKGQSLVYKEEYEGAIATLSDAITVDPSHPEPYLLRAGSQLAQVRLSAQTDQQLTIEGFVASFRQLSPQQQTPILNDINQATQLLQAADDSILAPILADLSIALTTGEITDRLRQSGVVF